MEFKNGSCLLPLVCTFRYTTAVYCLSFIWNAILPPSHFYSTFWDQNMLMLIIVDVKGISSTRKVNIAATVLLTISKWFLAFPLLSLLFLEDNRHLITGSTDGQVRDTCTIWEIWIRKLCTTTAFFPFRFGAFPCPMTSSATWWAKWIYRRWKKDMKCSRGFQAIQMVKYQLFFDTGNDLEIFITHFYMFPPKKL